MNETAEAPPRRDPPTAPGRLGAGLYLVSTPIGNARDITLRALDTLAAASLLAAEDTRSLRRLLAIHGIALGGRPLVAYHDHSGPEARTRLLAAIGEGASVAFASEAGTPLLADPGFRLVGEAIAAGHPVTAVPGPSAALAALAVAGLPTDRFLFAGFPPAAAGPRARWIAELAPVPATLVLYESPRRVGRLLTELGSALGTDRQAAVCRELTKRYEEVLRGPLGELAHRIGGAPLRGEVVLVIGRAAARGSPDSDFEGALLEAIGEHGLRDGAALIARRFGISRQDAYRAGLRLRGGK